MVKSFVLPGVLCAALMLPAPAGAQPPSAGAQPPSGTQPSAVSPATPNDYSKDASWLCRPGRHDACDIDLTTTVVAANGTLAREPFRAADCAARLIMR